MTTFWGGYLHELAMKGKVTKFNKQTLKKNVEF
jgi:hypothetical protein